MKLYCYLISANLHTEEVDMPDGDIVHKGLAWKYQKAYKQICDGQFGGDGLAREVVPVVWKDIQNGGDKPIQLLAEVAKQCQQILDRQRMFGQIDWQKEFAQIDELAQPIYAERRLKTLAVEACKPLFVNGIALSMLLGQSSLNRGKQGKSLKALYRKKGDIWIATS